MTELNTSIKSVRACGVVEGDQDRVQRERAQENRNRNCPVGAGGPAVVPSERLLTAHSAWAGVPEGVGPLAEHLGLTNTSAPQTPQARSWRRVRQGQATTA